MMLESKFQTNLSPEEVYEKAYRIEGWKVIQDPATFQVMIYFDQPPNGKCQISGSGIIMIWCEGADELECIRTMLNEVLQSEGNPKPLGKPVYVKRFEKKPAYYETWEEVRSRIWKNRAGHRSGSMERRNWKLEEATRHSSRQ